MICELCKRNSATIHIQEFINGEKHTWHLCEECALKKGLHDPAFAAPQFQEALKQLVEDIAGRMNSQIRKDDVPDLPDVICTKCGWDSARFRKTKRLGCPDCYDVFLPELIRIYTDARKFSAYSGKIPPRPEGLDAGLFADHCRSAAPTDQFELENLQKSLKEAVLREEFEQAAELRDRIRTLESGVMQKTEKEPVCP